MDQYVYKAGRCSIITLEITGKTNENRLGVADPLHAKFRTNKALVIDIENFETKEKMKEDCSRRDPDFEYKVGEEVKVDDYDEDIHEVCTTGIHYFKTKETAESWMGYKLDGLYRRWHENGQLESEANYKDGNLDGLYREFHENGKIKEEENYKDGNLDGLCRSWYCDGQLGEEANYKTGKLEGLYRRWTQTGKLDADVDYKDGRQEC
jgi:antitoxin component YwqK of YwqJK toxin-antitoxin module